MALIKSQQAPAGLSPFSMKDIENQARDLLLRARSRAEQLLAGAQAEAQRLKAEAIVEGRAQGKTEGIAAGLDEGRKNGQAAALAEHREQFAAALEALSGAAARLEESRQMLESEALRDVVELAIAIARRITKRQGLVDPATLAANVEEALRLVLHSHEVRIAIHPAQRQTLLRALPAIQAKWPQFKHIEMVDDEAIAPGGCRLSTNQGSVDADLETQLDRVVADLMPVPASSSETA